MSLPSKHGRLCPARGLRAGVPEAGPHLTSICFQHHPALRNWSSSPLPGVGCAHISSEKQPWARSPRPACWTLHSQNGPKRLSIRKRTVNRCAESRRGASLSNEDNKIQSHGNLAKHHGWKVEQRQPDRRARGSTSTSFPGGPAGLPQEIPRSAESMAGPGRPHTGSRQHDPRDPKRRCLQVYNTQCVPWTPDALSFSLQDAEDPLGRYAQPKKPVTKGQILQDSTRRTSYSGLMGKDRVARAGAPTGTELQFGMMEKFWRWMVATAA